MGRWARVDGSAAVGDEDIGDEAVWIEEFWVKGAVVNRFGKESWRIPL